jgi:predicted amidophosphoribosyltransferase
MTTNSIDEMSDQGSPQRNRHFPRLCRSCGSPLSRQEDTCWHCGAVWNYSPDAMTAAPDTIAAPSVLPDDAHRLVVAAAAHG